MCPPGIASSNSRSWGILASMHGRPAESLARQHSNGSARCASRRGDRPGDDGALGRAASWTRTAAPGVCRPKNDRTCWLDGASPRIVRSVRVVADERAGDRRGHPADRRLGVRRLEGGVLGRPTWRCRRSAIGRVHAGLEPRQPVQQQVDLQLRALGLRLRVVRLAHQDVQHPRRDVGQDEPGRDRVRAPSLVPGDLGRVLAGADRAHAGVEPDLGTGPAAAARQSRRTARPSRRPAPRVARAVAHHRVEEGAVLAQRRRRSSRRTCRAARRRRPSRGRCRRRSGAR